MRKLILFHLLFFSLACSKSNSLEVHEAPVFVSSSPTNNAKDVAVKAPIEVVFDEVITLSATHNITINGTAANVQASFTKLLFTETLLENTTYTIRIPKGAVVNTFGVASQSELQFVFTTESNQLAISANLVSANPSVEVVNLYKFLKDNYGKKIISATQANVSWNLNEAEWVKYHTGKYPAMATMDYIHLGASPANWIDYSKIDFIKDWWNNKGIVSASWHWLVPPTELETDPLKFTYTLSTSFKASNIPLDGTWENKVAKADLAKLVGYLKLLQDNNIPVIWRPLHEAAGNIYVYNNGTAWFWWGASGADAYKAVWQFVFNYFKDQGVHNLIWVWTTQTGDEAFYPGDAYVDIIGRDIYNNLDASKIAEEFKSIQKKHPTKLVTLSECGSVEKISTQWTSGAAWSYFMPWYDYDRTKDVNAAAFTLTTHQHADAAWWKDAMTKDYVISREQMPSLKGSK